MNAVFKSIFLTLEGGVWVLQDDSGKQFLPVNMPQSLKVANMRSTCQLTMASHVFSVFQVGEPVRIISYKIL